MFLFIFMYLHIFFRDLRVLCKASFSIVFPRMGGFCSKKRKFMGKFYGEVLLYMRELIIRSCQVRGSFINAFSNNLNTVNLFANHVGMFT